MTNYSQRLDEILAKHGAEPGEMTRSLKRAIKQLIADEMLVIIGEPEKDVDDEVSSLFYATRNGLRKQLRTKVAEWTGEVNDQL